MCQHDPLDLRRAKTKMQIRNRMTNTKGRQRTEKQKCKQNANMNRDEKQDVREHRQENQTQ